MEPDFGALAGTVLEVHLQDSEAVAAAYLPFMQLGGLFIPTAGTYRLGEEVRLRVVLHGEALQDLIRGTVAWITPLQAVGHRAAGIGLHFTADEACRLLNKKIEGLVAGLAAAALVLGS